MSNKPELHKNNSVQTKQNEYFAQGEKASMVGIIGNILLTLAKMVAGIVGHSTAMVADAAHSASDIISSLVVYVSLKIAKKPADREHPYGHGKAESLATVAVGIFLLLAGLSIAYSAVTSIIEGNVTRPGMLPLVAAVLSVAVKEIMFQYTLRVGKRIQSPATVANAWHHRSDAYSSLASLIGIAGARFGLLILDPLAGIAVTFFIIKMGWEITSDGIHQLMDGSGNNQIIEDLKQTIKDCDNVSKLKEIKSRQSGPYIFIDVIIGVDKDMTFEQSHQVAENVKRKIKNKYEKVNNVLIHVDPVENKDNALAL